MDQRYDDACDALDASVFSGELVSDIENLNGFKAYLDRWSRAVAEQELRNKENS